MENYWVYLVMIASVSHSLWNMMMKQSEDKTVFLWSLRIWSAIIFLPFCIILWPAGTQVTSDWIFWGMGSVVLHTIYGMVLSKAYEKSDFSLAYPIARGLGPLIVVAVGILWLNEPATMLSVIGSLLIFAGIYILYSGLRLRAGLHSIRAVLQSPYPILVGVSIASYTLFDKLALSVIPPIPLNIIENIGQVVLLWTLQVRKVPGVAARWKKEWGRMAAAGGLAGLAYILVLIVLTEIPVSFVAPVRESSIVIGSLLGIFILKEKFSFPKMIGAIVLFAGVVLIVW